MADRYDWSLGLDDKSMTTASDRAASSLDRLIKSMEKLGERTEKLDKKMEHGGEGLGRFMEKLHAGIEVARRFGEALKEVVQVPLEWTFEATSFKESTLLAMEAITGSADHARSLFNYAEQFAGYAPFETKEVAHIQRRFVAGGFSDEEAKSLMATATDFASLTGEGTGAMERFAFHVDQIKSVGHITGMMVRELALSGINSERLYGKIAKYLGTDIPTAMQRVSAGAVDWKTALASVEDVITDLGGGKLGNLTYKVSHTVAGLWSTLKSRPFELFKDIDKTAGWGKLKGALENLVDGLNPYNTNGPGARLKSNIENFFSGLFDNLFGDFAGPDGADRIADIIDEVGGAIKKTGQYLDIAGTAGKGFLKGLLDGLSVTDSLFGKDGSLDPEKMKKLEDTFIRMGRAVGVVVDKMGKLISVLGGPDQAELDRKTEQFRKERREQGLSQGEIYAHRVMNKLFGDPWKGTSLEGAYDRAVPIPGVTVVPVTIDAKSAPTMGGRGPLLVHAPMTFNINGTDANGDPETMARQLHDLMTGHLIATMEKTAEEQGDADGN